jgi:hypothetical protein
VIVRDLPSASLDALRRRLAAFGVRTVELDFMSRSRLDPVGQFAFHLDTAILGSTVFFRPGAEVDELTHEGCHVAVIPREHRSSVAGDATRWPGYIDEVAIMWLQVELQRDVPGLGVEVALAEMDRIGYSFLAERGEVKAAEWWATCEREVVADLAGYGLPTIAEIRETWRAIE